MGMYHPGYAEMYPRDDSHQVETSANDADAYADAAQRLALMNIARTALYTLLQLHSDAMGQELTYSVSRAWNELKARLEDKDA